MTTRGQAEAKQIASSNKHRGQAAEDNREGQKRSGSRGQIEDSTEGK
jgi:hypothetical protein